MSGSDQQTFYLDKASPALDAALRLVEIVQGELPAGASPVAILGAALLYVRNGFSLHARNTIPSAYLDAIAALAGGEIRGQAERLTQTMQLPPEYRALGVATIGDSFAGRLAENLALPVNGPVLESWPGPDRRAS